MEIKKQVMAKLLRNINIEEKESRKRFQEFHQRVSEASSVEEIMQAKRDFMVAYLKKMPFYDTTCYFCILHNVNCDDCEYGAIHGLCGTIKEFSDTHKKLPSWDKISRARDRVIDLFYTDYFTWTERY